MGQTPGTQGVESGESFDGEESTTMATAFQPQQTLERPLTIEDYETFPDDGNRYEIMGGQLFVTASPIVLHQWLSARLLGALNAFLLERQLGIALSAPVDVQFGRYDIVVPDVVVVLKENAGVIQEKRVIGAPDLIIEIISQSTAEQDYSRKAALYASQGVREYWIVEPKEKAIIVQVLQDDGYVTVERGADGMTRSVILPGFAIATDDLFGFPDWMTGEPAPSDD
jgi:Uma2 family endonuclease